MDLAEFLSLECPFLLPAAKSAKGDPQAILEAIDRAAPPDPKKTLWPGATAADAAAWQRDALKVQVEGFFRRQAIQASLTREERLEMHRVMVLSRTLDELLKKLFQEKKIAWESHPSPQ